MNQKEAEQAYLYQVKRTEELIKSMGNNPQAINAFITNTYAALAQQEPAFLWFSLGATVSATVGKNLQIATQGIINSAGQVEAAKIVLDKFSLGNQAIFKDIVPLYLTYEAIGPKGIELLATSNIQNPFKRDVVLEAMKNYAAMKEQQALIAGTMCLHLNDPAVVAQLFQIKKILN